MKSKILFLLFFFHSFSFANDDKTALSTVEIKKEKIEGLNGVNFYVYVNTNIESSLKSRTSADKKDLKEVLSETFLGGKKHLAYLGSWALQYQYVVPLVAFLGVYGITFYKIYKLNKRVNAKDAWFNWKSEISFDKLLSIQAKNLAQDLLNDIQKRYLNQSHPNDFITPLVLFTTEIENDIANLELYLKILKPINFLKLSKIFPVNDSNDAQTKLNKLIYLKNIFSNFSVELNRQRLLGDVSEIK